MRKGDHVLESVASSETLCSSLCLLRPLGSGTVWISSLPCGNTLSLGTLCTFPHDTILANWSVKWHLLSKRSSNKEICLCKEEKSPFHLPLYAKTPPNPGKSRVARIHGNSSKKWSACYTHSFSKGFGLKMTSGHQGILSYPVLCVYPSQTRNKTQNLCLPSLQRAYKLLGEVNMQPDRGKRQKQFNNWPKANRMKVNTFKLPFGVEISFRATEGRDLADWMEWTLRKSRRASNRWPTSWIRPANHIFNARGFSEIWSSGAFDRPSTLQSATAPTPWCCVPQLLTFACLGPAGIHVGSLGLSGFSPLLPQEESTVIMVP